MTRLSTSVFALVGVCNFLVPFGKQPDRQAQQQFLEATTNTIVDDLRAGLLGNVLPSTDTLPWRVEGPNIDSTSSAQFVRTILRAIARRPTTGTDSAAHTLAVSTTVTNATAELRVYRGMVWCTRGWPQHSSTSYHYYYRRSNSRWVFTGKGGGISSDPPPAPLDAAPPDKCARAIAR